jgi:dipeptidyl aminopeptidase/acylaminoacyl peptidase
VYGAASLAMLASGVGGGVWLERRRRPALAPSFHRLTFRRGLIRSARVAPDGQTILYGALWDGDRCRVHTVRVDGPESHSLDLPDANVLAISRSGEIAVALGPHADGIITAGTLARAPLAGGAPRQIVENVTFADWSPDGAELAIVRRLDGRDQLEFPIGTVLFAPSRGQGTGLGFSRVSPDGRRVAFVQYSSPGQLSGRVMAVDQSGTVTPLSGEYLNIHGLAWRGDEILFTAADERPLARALHAVTLAGTNRVITRMAGNTTVWDALPDGRLVIAQTDDRSVLVAHRRDDDRERDLSWLDASSLADLSRDGNLLLFSEFGLGGGPDGAVYLRGTNGSAAVRLGAGRGVALSPDARWALCAPSKVPAPYLEILPTGAGEPRRLADFGLGYISARWLPDGKRLVVLAVAPGRGARLYLQDLEAGAPAPLTPEGVSTWALSPDGSTVAAGVPGPAIRLVGIDGSGSRDVPGLTGTETPVGWIADGRLVMRLRDPASPRGQIYRVDPGTGRHDPWKNILPGERAGIMLLQSFRVTPDGLSHAYSWHRALSNLFVAGGLA